MRQGTVKESDRRDLSPPPGLKSFWTEWQVVVAGKVVARLDSDWEARDWAAKNDVEVVN